MISMFKQYKQKKKRAVDPNAPPRPTLLGQVKDLKDTKSMIEELRYIVDYQRNELDAMQTKLRRAEYNISLLTTYIKNRK